MAEVGASTCLTASVVSQQFGLRLLLEHARNCAHAFTPRVLGSDDRDRGQVAQALRIEVGRAENYSY